MNSDGGENDVHSTFFEGIFLPRLVLMAFTIYFSFLSTTTATHNLEGEYNLLRKKCPYHIATLSTTEYLQQSSFLKHQVASFSSGVCNLEVVKTKSFKEVSKFEVAFGKQYRNSFSGVDIKISAILKTLTSLPANSALLWLDSSTIVLNSIGNIQANSILHRNDILFIREVVERRVSANIGVILMKNTPDVVNFFNITLSYIWEGFWDQGIVCCLLGIPTRHSCEHIEKYRGEMKWSYLKRTFALIKSIKKSSKCYLDNNTIGGKKRKLPIFLKLIGNKDRRAECLQLFQRASENKNKLS